MSDALTYQIPSTTTVECDVCETENTVTYWDDLRTGRWERDAFTCSNCGEHHKAIDGDDIERGAAQVLFILLIIGAALTIIGGISLLGGHFEWWPMFLGGLWLVVITFFIALVKGGNEQEDR